MNDSTAKPATSGNTPDKDKNVLSDPVDLIEAAKKEIAVRQLARNKMLMFVERFTPNYDAGWIHKDICERLEQFSQDIVDQKDPRLMLFMPPRHGKSTLASIAFPAWHLGRHPSHEFISCSYSGSLAMSFSRKVRHLLREPTYQSMFETRLDPNSQSAEAWLTTDSGGYVAAGVGGGITGKGAHCAHFLMTVTTPLGKLPISEIAVGDQVLGYDHRTKQPKWTTVQAVSTQFKNDFVNVNGAVLTPDHRVWTNDRGYVRADDTAGSDLIVHAMQEKVPAQHQRNTPDYPPVWQTTKENFLQQGMRSYTDNQSGMCVWEQKSTTCQPLPRVPQQGQLRRFNLCLLRKRLQAGYRRAQKISSLTWARCTSVLWYNLLSGAPRKRSATPQNSKTCGAVGGLYWGLECEQAGYSQTQPTLWELWDEQTENKDARPPHQSPSQRSSARELAVDVRAMPQPLSSSVYGDSASSIAGDVSNYCGAAQRVVDIQTGTENFFCEGVLVHNCLVIDDPVRNREDAESEVSREANYNWFTSTAYTRLAPGAGVLIILTRWHDDDLAGRLLAEMDKGGDQWEIVSYPAIATEDEQFRKKGDALHPARYDKKALSRIRRAVGPRDWSALYQQNPVADDGDYFKRDMIRYFTPDDVDLSKLEKYTAWDLAIGQKEQNDYSVGITVGVDHRDRIYIIDVVRGRFNGLELVENILTSFEDHDPSIVGIEKGHIEMAVGPFLEKRIQERGLSSIYIQELKTGKRDKLARARAIQGRMQQGMVRFPKDAAFTDTLVGELLRFPNGKNDDQVDALSWLGLMMSDISGIRPAREAPPASWRDQLNRYHGPGLPRKRSAMTA